MVTVILLKSLPVCTRCKWSLSVSPRLYQSLQVQIGDCKSLAVTACLYQSSVVTVCHQHSYCLSDSLDWSSL